MTLRLKLAGAFALIIAAGSAASVLVIGAAVRTRMQDFVSAGDAARARNLAAYLGDYYETRGTFTGAFDAAATRFPDMPMMRLSPRERGGRGGRMGMMRPTAVSPRVVLAAPDGTVLFDSGPGKAPETGRATVERGTVVEAAGAVRGYVAVGSMLDPELRGLELSFLNSVTLAVIISSLAAALLAAGVGTSLVLHITSPLKKLEGAAARIAAGDLSARAVVRRRDEMGALAVNFNRMAGALEENERVRRKMAEDAAHELRTPVSLLQANVEMMIEGVYPLDRERLLSLNEEVGRLARLVADLDEQNRAAAPELRIAACSLADLIHPLLVQFRPRFAEKNVTTRSDFPAGLPAVPADPDKLSRVFTNILSNAVRHVNAGGSIAVAAAVDSLKRTAAVSVENSGSSVPAADLERIFERFYRADPARDREDGGSGLGLSISREIIRRHGGDIRAENLLPDGVRFTVTLPLA